MDFMMSFFPKMIPSYDIIKSKIAVLACSYGNMCSPFKRSDTNQPNYWAYEIGVYSEKQEFLGEVPNAINFDTKL